MKVLLWTTLCLALSAFVIGKAIAALRRGEPYRFGFLDGGLVGQGKEADPRIVIGGALAYLLLVGGLLAWPLGFYDWLGGLTSPCRDVLPLEEVRALGGEGFAESHHFALDTSCSWTATTPDFARVEVELDGRLGRNLGYRLDAEQAGARRESARVGPDLYRVDRPRETVFLFTRGQGGGTVTLSRAHFDEEALGAVRARLEGLDASLVEGFVEAERELATPAPAWRRYLPLILLLLIVLAIVGAVVFTMRRRQKLLRRALDDDE